MRGIRSHFPVCFWRNGKGWFGPAEILNTTEQNNVQCHNNHTKPSSYSKVRHKLPVATVHLDCDEDIQTPPLLQLQTLSHQSTNQLYTAILHITQDSDAKLISTS